MPTAAHRRPHSRYDPHGLTAAAFHEAGHAVAAVALELAVDHVSIRPDGVDAARCFVARTALEDLRVTVVRMAGAEAERRYRPDAQPSRRDLSGVPVPLRPWARLLAARLIKKCWPAVERVAAALLARGALTGSEVEDICEG